MSVRAPVLVTAAAILACLRGPALGAERAEVIVPQNAVVTEQVVDSRFSAVAVARQLREAIQRGSAFRVLELGPERLLSAEDRVVVVVPVITTARSSHETRAGSILEVTAHVGGGVWVLDPWTNSALYTATRLVSAPVRVALGHESRADTLVVEAFQQATSLWVRSCYEQLEREVSPFFIEGATIPIPADARSTKGLWRMGARDGVTAGMIVRTSAGALARVVSVAERFSTLRDVADDQARIQVGARYGTMAVLRPTERPEPTLVLRNLDSGEAGGAFGSNDQLTVSGLNDIVQSYVAKGGGLRVIPADAGGIAASEEFKRLSESVSRYSKLTVTNSGGTIHRETRVRLAETEPDLVAEVGILGTYHGIRRLPDSTQEHLFRVSLIASVGTTLPDGGWAIAGTRNVSAELAAVERAGVREISIEDAWFSVWRNACIQAGEKIRALALEAQGAGRDLKEGRALASGQVNWPGERPAPYTPLTWLRPVGEVVDAETRVRLGVLREKVEPSRGFLNAVVLEGERPKPDDVFLFRSGGLARRPVNVEVAGEGLAYLNSIGPEVLERLAAGAIAERSGASPQVGLSESGRRRFPSIQILVGTPTAVESADRTVISGDWRCRTWAAGDARRGEPLARAGVNYTEKRDYDAKRPLSPRDRNGELVAWTETALAKVIERATEKGMAQAWRAENAPAH